MFPFERALIAAFVAVTLVVLSTIDIERRIIPNRIVLPATALVLAARCLLFPGQASQWVLAAIVTASILVIPRLAGRNWMGMGDVKLGLLLGAALGWGALGAVALAFVCSFPVALAVLIRRGLAARNTALPFGPFLSLGALIVLYGPYLLNLSTH